MLTRPSWWLDQADVCWRAPIPRQKLVDALGRMIWQPGEDVGEPGPADLHCRASRSRRDQCKWTSARRDLRLYVAPSRCSPARHPVWLIVSKRVRATLAIIGHLEQYPLSAISAFE